LTCVDPLTKSQARGFQNERHHGKVLERHTVQETIIAETDVGQNVEALCSEFFHRARDVVARQQTGDFDVAAKIGVLHPNYLDVVIDRSNEFAEKFGRVLTGEESWVPTTTQRHESPRDVVLDSPTPGPRRPTE
jgi:hypothetical protein